MNESLIRHLDTLAGARVLVVGDVMLDTYLIGDADRISPEAPVPVVRVEETRHTLGGAGNVARNIAALGGRPVLVGMIGSDPAGDRVDAMLREALVDSRLIRIPGRPTISKTRVLARRQQMLRLDHENNAELTPQEYARMLDALAPLLPGCDVIIVSDYGKGMVNGRLLPHLMASSPRQPKVLVDPKPQNKAFYKGAYLLTPNAKETSEAVGLPVATRADILRAGQTLRRELAARHVLTTLGPDGMALFSAGESPDGEGESVLHLATAARQVFDVTGAGDTVIATIGLALAAGVPLAEACLLANYAAGIVVGKIGASTASVEELRAAVKSAPPDMAAW